MRSNLVPSAPWNIPAENNRDDIATIIYRDGRRYDYNGTESYQESSTSPQSLPPTFSFSPQRSGRDRADSYTSNLSSNSSTREAFASLNVQYERLGSSFPSAALGQPRQCASFNSLDLNHQFYESPTKLTNNVTDGDTTDYLPEPSQDHIVAEATGADSEEMFQIDDFVNLNQCNDLSEHQLSFDDGLNQPYAWSQPQISSNSLSLPQESLFTGVSMTRQATVATSTKSDDDRSQSIKLSGSPLNLDDRSSKPVALKANGQPKRTPGRKKGSHLSADKKAKTAFQRILSNCVYCKTGKRECDPGTPCKHCARQGIPCIRPVLRDLVDSMLSAHMRWHPYARTPSNFFKGGYRPLNGSATIPIIFGFGPPILMQVQGLSLFQASDRVHQHVWYSGDSSLNAKPKTSTDIVLPVQLLYPDQVEMLIDGHLDNLVNNYLSEFTIPRSMFTIFDSIVKLFKYYRTENEESADLLRISLKLLILVHDSRTSVDSNNPQIVQVLHQLAPGYNRAQRVVPCLIRAQLSRFTPILARSLLKTILEKLIQICASKRYDQHPLSLAVFALVLMTLESVMYHGARYSFHHFLGDENASIDESCVASLNNGEKSASELLKFYRDGFEGCHRMMAHVTQDGNLARTVPDQFLQDVCREIQHANTYLHEKQEVHVESIQNVSQLFDRYLARLFLMH